MQSFSNEKTKQRIIEHVEFVVKGEQIYQTKTAGFQSTKINQQSNIKAKETKMKGASIYPKLLMRGPPMREIC